MTKGPTIVAVRESLSVVGSSPRSVMERVEIAVRGLQGYTMARPSPNVAQIAFVTKKLFGSTTHVCSVTIAESARGMAVSIQGELESTRVDPLRAAVLGTSMDGLRDRDRDPGSFGPAPVVSDGMGSGWMVQAAGPPPVSVIDSGAGIVLPTPAWAPVRPVTPVAPIANPLDNALENSRTIMRPSATGVRAMPGGGAAGTGPRPITLRFGDGRQLPLTGGVLIGRDPVQRPGDPAATPVAINDGGVSKTHVLIGRTGDGVWIEDRRSTNGTMIVDSMGRQVTIPAAQRTVVEVPTTVLIGETRIVVSWA